MATRKATEKTKTQKKTGRKKPSRDLSTANRTEEQKTKKAKTNKNPVKANVEKVCPAVEDTVKTDEPVKIVKMGSGTTNQNMDFTNVKNIVTPYGTVTKITRTSDGNVLWEKD